MRPETVILFTLIASIWLLVFSIGARASIGDVTVLVRKPGQLVRSLAAIFVVVPAFALLITAVFPFAREVRFAIVALSVAPIPPILPLRAGLLGKDGNHAVGLLVLSSVVALGATPLLVDLASIVLDAKAQLPAHQVAKTLLISTGAPLGLGMALKSVFPAAAQRVQRPLYLAGMALLIAGFLVLVASSWRNIISLLGNGAILGIAATVAVGLVAGHLLGGPHERERGALALCAATRHPGVALSIAMSSFPDQKAGALAGVLLFLLVNIALTLPYIMWMKGRVSRDDKSAGAATSFAGGE
jgi:bile acid:Na+ symporter, BASS family